MTDEERICGVEGLTLRDWFAGQALAGIIPSEGFSDSSIEKDAESAYIYADWMLAKRNRIITRASKAIAKHWRIRLKREDSPPSFFDVVARYLDSPDAIPDAIPDVAVVETAQRYVDEWNQMVRKERPNTFLDGVLDAWPLEGKAEADDT